MKKIISNITIVKPGGNDTALVLGINRSMEEKKIINDTIMKKYKNVEQVGFIDLSKPELQMAGGEFCGNATRSTVFLALKGLPGETEIKVSGVNRLLKAGVSGKNTAWAQMPIYKNPKVISYQDNYMIIPLYGITLVIVEKKEKFINQQKAKKEALKILKQLGLITSVPASGVMFLYKKNGLYAIEPVVWVRDIKTFFYETACASGTTAVGLYLSQKQIIVDSLPVLQPSCKRIYVSVKKNSQYFISAKIDGPIKILKKNITLSFPCKRESISI
ncbi:MAG: hypothetical protein M1120_01085 [Patescibacteria group bacterium]|nr:hypothetical protein [Patescibacteria group bacterium]